MEIFIEQGPSKLKEILDSFINPGTGHIEINSKSARNILYDRLLAHYRSELKVLNPVVEVLAQIADDPSEDIIDFTQVLEEYSKKRLEVEAHNRELLDSAKTVSMRTPPQAEI